MSWKSRLKLKDFRVRAKPSNAFWLGLLFGTIVFTIVFWGIDYSLGTGDEALKVASVSYTHLPIGGGSSRVI